MGSIIDTYTIVWCIDWVKVTKIVTVFDTSCETVAYSDGSDGTWWTEDCSLATAPIVLADIDCATASPNVKECNSDAILAELQAINAKTVDYTLLLTAIKTAVESIDAKSSDLANILAAVDWLEALTTTGNATLTDIKAALLVIQIEAQAINANTDTLETLISTYTSVFQTESDQTQVILSDTLAVNTAIKAVLEATCADAFKQKVEVCNFPVANYNNNRHIEVLPWTPYIATGENSVTVLVKWVVNITMDWVTITYDTWDTISFDASSLLTNDITIDAISWRAIVLLLK